MDVAGRGVGDGAKSEGPTANGTMPHSHRRTRAARALKTRAVSRTRTGTEREFLFKEKLKGLTKSEGTGDGSSTGQEFGL